MPGVGLLFFLVSPELPAYGAVLRSLQPIHTETSDCITSREKPWVFQTHHQQSSVLLAILSNCEGDWERKLVFILACVVTLHYFYQVLVMTFSVDFKIW